MVSVTYLGYYRCHCSSSFTPPKGLIMTNVVDSSLIAVLTGDIVKSRQISQEGYDDLLYSLNNVLSYVSEQHLDNGFQLMRGDSFQLVIHDAVNAFKYALLIRLALKERDDDFDCRVSIGLGSNDVIRHQIGNSTGDAFTLSGMGLDELKNRCLQITSIDNGFNQRVGLLVDYADHQLSQITQRQAAIVQLKLRRPELIQQQIADLLSAQRVSISRSLKTARFDLLEQNISYIETQIKALIQ